MTREIFDDSLVPELPEILTSHSTATAYGPDGKQLSTTAQPFTYPWQLLSIGFVKGSGRSRVTCVFETNGKVVYAVIDAAGFRGVNRNSSR